MTTDTQAAPAIETVQTTRTGRTAATGLSGADGVAQVIAAQDRPTVYGIPGGYAAYIFSALHSLQDVVDVNLVRQESLATVMAEAQGRLTGRPAFVIAQGAWVLGNASIGVMEAHLGASPMVLLIDATDGGSYSHLGPYQGGLGGYGSYDLVAALKAITKRVFVATDPAQAVQMTQLAVKHATTGEPGPVAVIFNARSLRKALGSAGEPATFLKRSCANDSPPVASEQSLARAADAIRNAERPVIVAGNGVRLAQSEADLLALAAALDIPVATTPGGKGVFPESHKLGVGVIGGFGHDTANEIVGNADLVLALGTKLGTTDTANHHPNLINPERQTLVQVDVEPLNLGWTYPVDVSVEGGLADALPRLRAALGGYAGGGEGRVRAIRAAEGYFDRAFTSSDSELSGRDVIYLLSQTLADDAIVTCDAGENRLFVLRDYQTKAGGTVLQPNGGGGMGYAVPSAMGAAKVFPGRQVVAVCGDGGLGMSLHGLVSAVELGISFTILVLDNGVLGWVYSGQGNRPIASEFKDFDYAAIARAIGCKATTVSTLDEARSALRTAFDEAGVNVIVAKTSTADKYQHILAAINSSDIYAISPKK